MLVELVHKVFVELSAEYHLHYLDRLLVGVAQTVHEFAFLVHAFEHCVYLGTAAMNEHDFDADHG